jgi:hypothetical protein
MSKRLLNKKQLIKLLFGIGAVLLLLLLIIVFLPPKKDVPLNNSPTLILETPNKISLLETNEFLVDVNISSLGNTLYPAVSMNLSFDSSRLEFISVEEGNVFIRNNENDVTQKLPQWNCNSEQSNNTGLISIMYLDTTGGKNAFSKELLAEEDNVVLRLKFRLRGSARKGDVYDLIVEDAIFAASDETNSLAMTRDTLKVRNGKIVIGE